MNNLSYYKTILVCDKMFINKSYFTIIDKFKKNFYGNVCEDISQLNIVGDEYIYVCGKIDELSKYFISHTNILVINELSTYNGKHYRTVSLGEVPINVHNVGVLFKNFFPEKHNYFDSLVTSHEFQTLSESNKSSNAHRKGIYLTPIKKENDELKYHLLRCSTTLSGGSDNFREVDQEIVTKLNNISKYIFSKDVKFNHVLAQIYYNFPQGNKDKKARIKSHSDKTKDMPKDGLMAFCTFYDFSSTPKLKKSETDEYDICYNKTSVLTKLRFKLKDCVKDESLTKQFDVILYPNSVFMISLETNRLYTHEISPSTLPSDKIPTRLGYVVRCSNTKASFKDNKTYIVKDNKYIELCEPTNSDFIELKKKYAIENLTTEMPDYSEIYFSMNKGDYIKPIY